MKVGSVDEAAAAAADGRFFFLAVLAGFLLSTPASSGSNGADDLADTGFATDAAAAVLVEEGGDEEGARSPRPGQRARSALTRPAQFRATAEIALPMADERAGLAGCLPWDACAEETTKYSSPHTLADW